MLFFTVSTSFIVFFLTWFNHCTGVNFIFKFGIYERVRGGSIIGRGCVGGGGQHHYQHHQGNWCDFSMNMGTCGVCRSSIIVRSNGGISSINIRRNFGITIGGIYNVLNCYWCFGCFWNIDCVLSMNIEVFWFCQTRIVFSSIGGIISIIVSSTRVISVGGITQNISGVFWSLGQFWNIDCNLSINIGIWRILIQGIRRKYPWDRWLRCRSHRDSGK